MATPYRLITIPPSHYCEKARWALELAGVPFVEERHPPVLHMRAAGKGRASGHSTPVLVAGDRVVPDSTDILVFLQQRRDGGWRPYPEDPDLREKAAELEELFDTRLGPHTRRLAYFYLMQHRRLFLDSVLAGVEGAERALFRMTVPVIVFLMRRGMNITAESAERSHGFVRQVITEVNGLLADGRSNLVGSELTAADLTFAALAAPVILPEKYGSPLPSMSELPIALRGVVEDFRGTAAGEFVLRIYEDHR